MFGRHIASEPTVHSIPDFSPLIHVISSTNCFTRFLDQFEAILAYKHATGSKISHIGERLFKVTDFTV